MTIRTYAISRSETIEWDTFKEQNDWVAEDLKNKNWDDKPIPRKCVAIYYTVNKIEKKVMDKLYITTYDPDYKDDFKKLNIKWIEEIFKVEPSDIKQLCYPEESITEKGGEIFFLVTADLQVIGTVAMVVKNGKVELGKLTVSSDFQSRGFSHPLMIESIQWARIRNFTNVLILTSTLLAGAIKLYEFYGFKTIQTGPHPDYSRCDIVLKLDF
ncbi:unnamed protein product [Cunninghamella blakesleeana]